jgi:ligand-binding sensor domain-containing protein
MGKLATLLSRRNLLRLSGWLPFLIFRYAVLAEKTAAPHLEYTRTVWRVSDGLPEDTVQALTESSEGFLWIGTTGGLARFEGPISRFTAKGWRSPYRSTVSFALRCAGQRRQSLGGD